MLLTSSFFSMPPQQQYYSPYTPPRSSPLSERSANVAPRLFDFSMASQSDEKKSPTPQRAYKANPVIQTRDAATKRRRDMFFKRVQNGREDKKWEARGEQVRANTIPCFHLILIIRRSNNSTLSPSANAGKPRRRVKHRRKKTRWSNKSLKTRLCPVGQPRCLKQHKR